MKRHHTRGRLICRLLPAVLGAGLWIAPVGALGGVAVAQPEQREHGEQPELPGSLRNARVAKAMPADPGQRAAARLTFFAGGLSAEQVAELATVAPNVTIVTGLNRQSALERAAEADGIDGRLVSPDLLEKAGKLVWVHSPSAGVERLVTIPGIGDRASLVVTNARGVHGPAIADHAMAMLLYLTRQIGHYEAAMEKEQWERSEPPVRPVTLQGKTMLVVGIGGIGEEIGRRAHGFGMRVLATRRSDSPAPDFVERVGKPEELRSMVKEADVVAICVPLTTETEHLFDAGMFEAMKRGSYVINIARGKVIDTQALMAALKDGRVAGAALDVTDPEPLPPGHALWKMPNVIITPHVAADGELTDQRWWALYKENMRRFGAGEPLLNCVDVKAGY
ncbi:MAG: Glyoxylate/hydroxypyruvate reductase B [Phycisphaerales bacterium]|nr:Glyoxylate/hydroxypyruvate reductase B [Phycisphaerales bacterium]